MEILMRGTAFANSNGKEPMNYSIYRISKHFLALIFLTSLAASAAIIPPSENSNVKLEWDYPLDQLSPTLFFNIYHSTNINVPVSQWQVLTNVVGTNLSVVLPKLEGTHFFTITASNASGESAFAGQSF